MVAELWRYIIASILYTAEIQAMDLEQRANSMHDNEQLRIYEVKVYEGILLHLPEWNSADTCTLKEAEKEYELRV